MSREFHSGRKGQQLTPDTLYRILKNMLGDDLARKKYKQLTGEEYRPVESEIANESKGLF